MMALPVVMMVMMMKETKEVIGGQRVVLGREVWPAK